MQSWRSVKFPVPMLAKTNRLQNPYLNNSSVTAVTSVSNFVHLNDRSRVDLNEQSESQDEDLKKKLREEHHIKINSGRLMTFSRQNNHLVQSQQISSSYNNLLKKNLKKASKLKQQDSDSNQPNQITPPAHSQLKNIKIGCIQSENEEIADEEEGRLPQSKGKSNANIILHFPKSYKPVLSSASQVVSHGSESRLKQSIIERIKHQGFAQSQVIDLKHYESRLIENNYIQQRNNNYKEEKKEMKNTKNRKRKSIFTAHNQQTKIFQKKETKNNESKNRISQPQRQEIRRYSPKVQDCFFHSRQVDKCLDIIKNLTERNGQKGQLGAYTDSQNEANNLLEMKSQIEHETLRISFLTDKILAQTTLDSLNNKEVNEQINKLKYDTQSVLDRIGQFEQKKLKCPGQSHSIGKGRMQRMEFKQELIHELQKISKILIYIQQVQRRYKICSQKLSSINKKTADICRVQRLEKLKKQSEICKCIYGLEESKFHGQQAQLIGLVQAYNNFVDKEMGQLKQILEFQI